MSDDKNILPSHSDCCAPLYNRKVRKEKVLHYTLLLRISRSRKKIHQIKRLRTLKKGSELSVLTALSHLSKGESSTKWAKISKKAQFREVENSVPLRMKSKAIR